MFGNNKTIKELKKLKDKPIDAEFLTVLRSRLKEYMSFHPVRETVTYRPAMRRSPFITNLMRAGVMVPLILGLVILSGGGIAYASQDALPGETLYPVKTLTEDVRSALTTDPVSKARLEISFAERRIAELQKLLEEKGVEPRGLEIAEARLQKNLARAADMVKISARSGKNGEFAAEIIDKLNRQRSSVRDMFAKSNKGFRAKQKELHSKLLEALSAEDVELRETLQAELDEIKAMKAGIKKHQNSFLGLMDKERSRLLYELEEGDRQLEEVRVSSEEAEETKQEAQEVWEEIEDKLETAEKALDVADEAEDIEDAASALDLIEEVLELAPEDSQPETVDSTDAIDAEIENVLKELEAIDFDLDDIDVPR